MDAQRKLIDVFGSEVYGQEAGVEEPAGEQSSLAPCATCGVLVLTARHAGGQLVVVEAARQTYTLVFMPREQYPRAAQSRGYPAHQCRLS